MFDKILTPIGVLYISCDNNVISEVFFEDEKKTPINIEENSLSRETKLQLTEYFSGKRKKFHLPLFLNGTDFQKSVWEQLIKIPYGKTCSYKDIAVNINNEKSCRAVGGANNKNKIAVIIPCHRVIGHNKKLVGYAGGLWRKQWLLNLENGDVEK